MTEVKCAKCGNDGSEGGLYVTIDAQWDKARQVWVLEMREDEGGDELDCITCDHRTPSPPFPYGSTVGRTS